MSENNEALQAAINLIAEENKKAEMRCSEGINSLLKVDGCEIKVFVKIGDAKIPIEQVLSLPYEVTVIKAK